jgi:hypothetical protein
MTRTLKRQLEEELELNKPLNVRPSIRHTTPRDDDGFSPLHEPSLSAGAATDLAEPRAAGEAIPHEAVPHEGVPDEHLSDDRVPDTNSEAVMPGSDREPRREA